MRHCLDMDVTVDMDGLRIAKLARYSQYELLH